MEETKGEIWRDIPGYEGLYQASNLGRIKSLSREVIKNGGVTRLPERLRKQAPNIRTGYMQLRLHKEGKGKTLKVHRLVMTAFYGVSRLHVNHIDGDKQNNLLENLEYCTRRDNQLHAYKLGLKVPAHSTGVGSKNGASKLLEQQALEIYQDPRDYIEIASDYNVSRSLVGLIKRKERWKHIHDVI